MRTEFSAAQLADPGLREANDILRKCVHCGFCNATCPTFMLLGDELDGPRGRIYLLKNLLEHDAQPSPQTVTHLDRCLSCLSCMTTCPSGVNYMRLVDAGRAYIEKKHRRPLGERLFRWFLARVLPYPARFRAVLALAGLLSPFRALLPGRLRNALALRAGARRTAPQTRPRRALQGSPAAGRDAEKAVGVIAGCAQQVIGRDINAATIRLLERQGCPTRLLRRPGCCGAIEHHLGQTALAERRFRQNIRDWLKQVDRHSLKALLVNASGCGTMLKEYGHLLRQDPALAAAASRVSALSQDVAEFLSGPLAGPLRGLDKASTQGLRVAYQSPCSMQHGQKVDAQPMALLKQAGFDPRELPEKFMCCGSAGTYNLLQPELAKALGERKAACIAQTGAELVASGNLGCMTHLRQFTDIPILHTVELLDWASGGPKPF